MNSTFSGSAGLGLRIPHIDDLLAQPDEVPLLELMVDNWLYTGGITAYYIDRLRDHFELSLHGVGLSIGSVTPLDKRYLQRVKSLMDRSGAKLYSEHLSFSRTPKRHLADLLPLPYTTESLEFLLPRVRQVQDILERPLYLENVSSYFAYQEDTMSEARFLTELVIHSGCKLLLDINNLYVNQINLGREALQAIHQLPANSVGYMHLAGYEEQEHYLVDTHGSCVAEPVWSLYDSALQRFGPQPTIIEWDQALPALDVLKQQMHQAQTRIDQHRKQAA